MTCLPPGVEKNIYTGKKRSVRERKLVKKRKEKKAKKRIEENRIRRETGIKEEQCYSLFGYKSKER